MIKGFSLGGFFGLCIDLRNFISVNGNFSQLNYLGFLDVALNGRNDGQDANG